jgi:hypothetical protein
MTVFLGGAQPGCTLAELRQQLQGRLSQLSDADADSFINDAHREFHEHENWPWLQVQATGPTPLELSDLGRVEYVREVATNRELRYAERSWLVVQGYPDLTVTGTPAWWYRDGTGTIATLPVSTDDVEVTYWLEPSDLLAEDDQTASPKRYCPIILDWAYVKALQSRRDNPELAASLRREIEARVQRVAWKVMRPSTEPTRIIMRAGGE